MTRGFYMVIAMLCLFGVMYSISNNDGSTNLYTWICVVSLFLFVGLSLYPQEKELKAKQTSESKESEE